jgi:hypothetical protein
MNNSDTDIDKSSRSLFLRRFALGVLIGAFIAIVLRVL